MTLDLFQNQNTDHLPTISEAELSDEAVLREIWDVKRALGDQLTILGHHYQQDDVIQFADFTGDSLALAKEAAKLKSAKYIVFCGVHFMAETADMLTSADQVVILPDLNAGCSMADMANNDEIEKTWDHIASHTPAKIVPITYINCTAKLKAFVGDHGGAICTSSNARSVIEWAFKQGEKLLFFPDQHLGRNTCYDLGISLEDMVVYNPLKFQGGVTPEQIKKAKVILWYGFCSVHQGFTAAQVQAIKAKQPDVTVIVHPECPFDVVQAADEAGSTSFIIDRIKNAPSGSKFAVGTEINLVNRLNHQFPDKEVFSLSPYQCLCTTMYRVRPRWLLASLRAIQQDNPINIIQVPESVKISSLKALDRMLSIN